MSAGWWCEAGATVQQSGEGDCVAGAGVHLFLAGRVPDLKLDAVVVNRDGLGHERGARGEALACE